MTQRSFFSAEQHAPALSRRAWLGTAAALAAPWSSVWAQPASAAAEEAQAPPMPALGSELKVPRVVLLDGSVYEPAQADGKSLLVYWWASTCPFCALQSPSMDAFWKRHRASGLQMLALSVDRTPEAAAAYLKKTGYSFPAGWTSPAWRKTFPKPKGLPITLLRGVDGRLKLAEKGQMFDEDVQAIAQLLR
jgi:thiol-disulfide isomerase/thioredoxin